jgi:plastocyanin
MRRLIVIAVGLILFVPGPASAQTETVTVNNNNFLPFRVHGEPGDSVQWTWTLTGPVEHNVKQNALLFYSGPPTSEAGHMYTAVFSAGKFDYYCEVHGGPNQGMNGEVFVRPMATDGPEGNTFLVRWAVPNSETGDLYDVQYRIGQGEWQSWKKNTSQLKAVFGKNGNPELVDPGTTYFFRARSQNDEGNSRWSPKEQFEA